MLRGSSIKHLRSVLWSAGSFNCDKSHKLHFKQKEDDVGKLQEASVRLAKVFSLDTAVAVLTNEWDHFEQHQMFLSKERVFFSLLLTGLNKSDDRIGLTQRFLGFALCT